MTHPLHTPFHSASGASGRTPNLTLEEARSRAAAVKGPVAYTLALRMQARSHVYEGRVDIEFELKEVPASLFLDYQGRKVCELKVNGEKVASKVHRNDRIPLAPRLLRPGHNRVEVAFESDYDNDGAGLHKSLDPVDQREYFYATLEPFDCNRIFPCFDQPDLKGTYALTVAAPPEWVVVASGEETSALDEGDLRVHSFRRTEPFSTYIFGLVAGPFACWSDPLARIPSRILAPQSAAARVDHEEIFEITRQGFDFYEPYFEIAYPFRKYDQVFCPQFNWGAMENVACVCFNDRYLFRHEPTEVERQRRANTILHEMAHMWFGNLVTMEWWNDLWLNESFATYMANLALVKATRFQRAWDAFYQSTKSWAYWQDQLPTTHPIETEVGDTQTTFTNFDGITYGKGASVLKQLAYCLGEEPFRAGVASYLRTFSWKNARREDFMRHLGKAAGRSMKRWTRLWLETSGSNGLVPAWSAEDGKITDFSLLQEPGNGDQALRPHALEVGLYRRARRGGLQLATSQAVEIDRARTQVSELVGLPQPDFVLANEGDHAFAKIYLDPASLEFAMDHLEELPTFLARAAVWRAVWNMVRDARTPAARLVELFLAKAAPEPEDQIVQVGFASVRTVVDTYLPLEERAARVAELYELAWKQVRACPQGSDLQKVWFGIFLGTSEGDEAVERLVRMLLGQEFVRGVELDQDKRWSMVQRLSALGAPSAHDLVEEEKRRDATERGQTAAFQAWVARPEPEVKAAAWQRFVEDLDSPLDLIRTGMAGFWFPTQRTLLAPYVKRFFEAVPGLDRGPYFTDAFVGKLYPGLMVAPETLAEAQRTLERNPRLPVPVRRALVEHNHELAVALRARELAASA